MTFCRGMEFSTTPFAIPRRDTVDQGPLFGERTYRWLPARSTVTVRYMIMLFVTPEKFGGVSQVSIQSGHAVVTEAESGNRQLSVASRQFLCNSGSASFHGRRRHFYECPGRRYRIEHV